MAELDRFDEAELHVETTTMFANVVESVRLIEQDELLAARVAARSSTTLRSALRPFTAGSSERDPVADC